MAYAENQVTIEIVNDGAPGANGTTFIPSVSTSGDISWTNDGGKPNPTTRNIKGPQGDPGNPGDPGVGISAIVTEYYLSTSTSSATGGSWSTTPRAYETGKYYWTRQKITYTNGNTGYAPSSAGVYDQAVTTMNVNAYNADQVATAVNQHFWTDSNGVHVSSDASSATGDQNVILNSSGMLFRKNSNNLLALLPATPAVAFYDGTGNAGSNELARLTSTDVSLAKGKALLKYSEDGSAFGLSDSHRVVLSKNTDEANVRNDATLSSRSISTFSNSTPMAFVNANHKSSSSYKYGEVGLYAWSGSSAIPAYIILTNGTSDSVLGKSNALVISAGNFAIAQNGDITSTQINYLLQTASDAWASAQDLETYCYTTMKDMIVEQGTSGNWRYRKWSSGFIEAWYESTATASATTAVNISSRTVSYRSTWSTTIPSAIGFTSTPKIIVSLGSSSDIRMSINGAASSTTAIGGYCWRSSSSTSTYDITPRIYAWGS